LLPRRLSPVAREHRLARASRRARDLDWCRVRCLPRSPFALRRLAHARLPRGDAGRSTIPGGGRLRHRRQCLDGGMALSWRHLLRAVAPLELLARRRGLHGTLPDPLHPRPRAAPDRGAHRRRHVLHAAARPGLVRAAGVERQPPPRLSRHHALLCRLPRPPRVIYAALGLVALIAVAMRAVGVEQMPALQNLYLIPVLWAAFARGTLGGIL